MLQYNYNCIIIFLVGVDYDAAPVIATFNTGDTSVSVTIPVMDDRVVDEEDEEFSIMLSKLLTSGVKVELGNVNTATGIIKDTSKEVP